jgi:5'-methylthioadenosine phosphorylase
MIGLIGGTGIDKIKDVEILRQDDINTPYGKPSEKLSFLFYDNHEFIFLPRHGESHSIPPHKINYRANIWALKKLGVEQVFSIAIVGAIDRKVKPGDIVIPDQIIDYTYGREHTFFDGDLKPVEHIDFTYPFSEVLRSKIINLAKKLKINLIESGTYAAVQGPRLESAAEIDRYEKDGASIVGMTCMPEAALARELGLEYFVICPAVNYAAGRKDSKKELSHQTIVANSEKIMTEVFNLFIYFLRNNGD